MSNETEIAPGTPLEGGFYAGKLRVGDDIFAVIVSPNDEGDHDDTEWGEYGELVEDANSFFDGLANTEAMAKAGNELAQWARQLRIGGHDDWYLPSRDELELCYRNLKPTTQENYCWRGDNPSSVPVGYPYSDHLPAQTGIAEFRKDNEQAFDDAWYWSSTQYSANGAWYQHFGGGSQYTSDKGDRLRARAVRRFKLSN